jgi:ABC-type protease/lipase transport system fused ATPase/permease subunit
LMFTLVQPSPQLLLQFDKVMLMSKGAVMYFGPSSGVLEHTFRLGYRYAHDASVSDPYAIILRRISDLCLF